MGYAMGHVMERNAEHNMEHKLLIAEPCHLLLSALANYFSRDGFDVRTAGTPAGLFEELTRELPHVLLLEPELLCGVVPCGVPFVPTVLLTRCMEEAAACLPENFLVGGKFNKPARLSEIGEFLRAGANRGFAVAEFQG
jgi:hypothetical protein